MLLETALINRTDRKGRYNQPGRQLVSVDAPVEIDTRFLVRVLWVRLDQRAFDYNASTCVDAKPYQPTMAVCAHNIMAVLEANDVNVAIAAMIKRALDYALWQKVVTNHFVVWVQMVDGKLPTVTVFVKA